MHRVVYICCTQTLLRTNDCSLSTSLNPESLSPVFWWGGRIGCGFCGFRKVEGPGDLNSEEEEQSGMP